MEAVINWGLAITVLFLMALDSVLAVLLMVVIDKKEAEKEKSCLLSYENKQLINENEKLYNHIFVLEEIEQKK